MLATRFSVLALMLCLHGMPVLAADNPAAAANTEGAPSQQAGNAAPSAPAATAPTPAPPGPIGFAAEFAERLAAGANLAASDREDRAALAQFYEARQQEPVWTSATSFTPAAEAAMAEIRRADEWGLDAKAFPLPVLPGKTELTRAQRADAEIALSLAILKYARHAHGGRAEPTSLSRNLDRKLTLLDPTLVIGEVAKAESPDAYLRSLHPQHPQFEALRQKLLALKHGQPVAQAEASPPAEAKTAGKKVSAAGSEPASQRKLLVNMEEWRWMPEQLGDYYVWVNIPEFTLRVVKNGKIIHTERVVAGKRETPTPVFSQDLEQVIFQPSWGVPESIKRDDVLPSLRRGSARLFTFYHLKIQKGGRDVDPASVDWSTADIRNYHVFQPAGENSVLGKVKFRFPNKHDVYMHDTPTKNLFDAQVRAFSHGCMRVRNPQRLAELVLAEDQSWPAERVAAAFKGGPQNNQVNISRKMPVHITYFTAMVDDAGKLKLFPDIYNHEQRIALGMEGKAHLVAQLVKEEKPSHAEVIGRLSGSTSSGAIGGMRSKQEWINRAFENN